MREEEELKKALAKSRTKLTGIIGGFQSPPTRQRKRVAPLIKNGAEVLRGLMEHQDASSWNWWRIEDWPLGFSGKIQGGKVHATRDMLENFLQYTGISAKRTRSALFESLKTARIERALELLDDLHVAQYGKEGKPAVDKARHEYEKHLAKPRSVFLSSRI